MLLVRQHAVKAKDNTPALTMTTTSQSSASKWLRKKVVSPNTSRLSHRVAPLPKQHPLTRPTITSRPETLHRTMAATALPLPRRLMGGQAV
jgi:hypothetical protein